MISASFKSRFLSACVLGPLVLGAIIYGGIIFQTFAALAFGLAIKEWVGMARLSNHVGRDAVLGICYITLCFFALITVRLDLEQGLFLTFCLMLGVWASDIGAYFAGKFIGGPKLLVKISPNKTWAGFAGGMVASTLVLAALNVYEPFTTLPGALIIGAAFTIVGQAGDLMVSGYKRHVGVKDTGTLIPGHGGILDRIDALLLVSPFFLIVLLGIVE